MPMTGAAPIAAPGWTADKETGVRIVDCDVHHSFESPEQLLPYLSKFYQEHLYDQGVHFAGGGYPNTPLRKTRNDLKDPGLKRRDFNFTLEFTQRELLDPWNIDVALLTGSPSDIYGAAGLPDPDYGAALCRAFNDYTIEHWLERDERVVHAILVAPTDPAQAVAEINRLAGRKDTVAVHVPLSTAMPLGNRFYHPIWEACAEHGLPVVSHIGGGGATGNTMTPVGYPTYYMETRMARPGGGECAGRVADLRGGVREVPDPAVRHDRGAATVGGVGDVAPGFRLEGNSRPDAVAQAAAERVFPRPHPGRHPADARAGAAGAVAVDAGHAARRRDADLLQRLPALRPERSGHRAAGHLRPHAPAHLRRQRPGDAAHAGRVAVAAGAGRGARRVVVGKAGEIPEGGRKLIVPFRGRAGIGVFNVGGTLYALRNICPHNLGPLCTGHVSGRFVASAPPSRAGATLTMDRDGEILRCPWHNWAFDITDGSCLGDPRLRVKTYPVSIEGDDVVVAYAEG